MPWSRHRRRIEELLRELLDHSREDPRGNAGERKGRAGASASVCIAALAGGPVLDEEDEAQPASSLEITVAKTRPEGLEITWPAAPDGDSYRVARGELGAWYSHATDEAAGQEVCDTNGTLSWEEPIGQSRRAASTTWPCP